MKPSIKAEIFLDSIRTVPVDSFAEFRTLDEFAEQIAVFLMDNFSSHITGERKTVTVITKPYHDSKQTMVESNIWGTFQTLMFEPGKAEENRRPSRVEVD
jgi:hypothetical protein